MSQTESFTSETSQLATNWASDSLRTDAGSQFISSYLTAPEILTVDGDSQSGQSSDASASDLFDREASSSGIASSSTDSALGALLGDSDESDQESSDSSSDEDDSGGDGDSGGGDSDSQEKADGTQGWQPFVVPNLIQMPAAPTLPAESHLADLLALTPVGTGTFSETTTVAPNPVKGTIDEGGRTGNVIASWSTTVTVSQEWISPTKWTVHQSRTTSFSVDETTTDADGIEYRMLREATTTLTIVVSDGTDSTLSFTADDRLSHFVFDAWDNSDSTTGEIDRGFFNGRVTLTADVGLLSTEKRTTLPDGSGGRERGIGYTTGRGGDLAVSGSYERFFSTGTLQTFSRKAVPDPHAARTESRIFYVTPGGNAEYLDAEGNFNITGSVSNRAGMDAWVTTPEGDEIDPESISGETRFDTLVSGTSVVSQKLDFASQTSVPPRPDADPRSRPDYEYMGLAFEDSGAGSSGLDFHAHSSFGTTSRPVAAPGSVLPLHGSLRDSYADRSRSRSTSESAAFARASGAAAAGSTGVIRSNLTTRFDDDGSTTLQLSYASRNEEFVQEPWEFINTGTEIYIELNLSGETEFAVTPAGGLPRADLRTKGSIDGRSMIEIWETSRRSSDNPVPDERWERAASHHHETGALSSDSDFEASWDLTIGAGLISVFVAATPTVSGTFSASAEGSFTQRDDADTLDVWIYSDSGNHAQTVRGTGFDATETVWSMDVDLATAKLKTSSQVFNRMGFNGSTDTSPEEPDPAEAQLDRIQLALDVAGMVPLLGEAADLANAGISVYRGDWFGAGTSLVSVIPVFGDAIGKGGKLAKEGAEAASKHLDKTDEVAEGLGTLIKKTCFPAGTPVYTSDGDKPIEDVRAGDWVWSYSLVESQWHLKPVLETFTHDYKGESVFVTVNGETIEYGLAIREFETCLEMDGEDSLSRLALGQTLYSIEDYQASENILREFVAQHPSDPRGLYDLGRTREAQGDRAEAQKYYRLALQNSPGELITLAINHRLDRQQLPG